MSLTSRLTFPFDGRAAPPLAPAAGPGWEEPTSQLHPGLRPELDYVFTHEHSWGRRMMAVAMLAHPRPCVAARRNGLRAPLGSIPFGTMLELAARPSHYAHFLRAQSLRGHNGTAGPPPNLRWTFSVASGMLGKRTDFGKFSYVVRSLIGDGRQRNAPPVHTGEWFLRHCHRFCAVPD